jgi:hypothetical protein
MKSSASPASVERALFGDPDYLYSNQGGGGHPVDPSQVKKAAKETTRL